MYSETIAVGRMKPALTGKFAKQNVFYGARTTKKCNIMMSKCPTEKLIYKISQYLTADWSVGLWYFT